jgi:4-hydroxy-3-polyprenylbenzoate decarboxylase
MQVHDGQSTGMHWQRQKVAAEHYRDRMRESMPNESGAGAPARAAVDIMARSSGGSILAEGDRPTGRMDVAVAIGTEPALTFSAIVPAPPDVEEFIIAGFLRQKPVELVKCETIDLEVPADAEIILEGYVNLDELRTAGPFGDHTGFYSLEDEYPVFHVTCVTHRKDNTRPPSSASPTRRRLDGQGRRTHFVPLMKLTILSDDINLPIEGIPQPDDCFDPQVYPDKREK